MITRVAIKNFKALRDVEVNLTSLNLFTGLNGMGKSSFIQALLLLRQSEANFLPELKGLVLKGEIVDLGKGKDIYNINSDDEFIRFEVDEDYEEFINVKYKYIADSNVLPLDVETGVGNLNYASLFTNRFTYLKAERIQPEHNYIANLYEIKQNNFLGYKGENAPLFIALNQREPVPLQHVQHEKAVANNLLANIDAWMNEITPGSHVISTYYNELDIVTIGYQFDMGTELTPKFSPVNVGFGFTYVLPILTAVLSAQQGDLLIIDSPESHLSPHGQAKLGELLAKAASDGVQVIIESHSDHIFNGIRVAVKNKHIQPDDVSIFYFERDENSTEHSTSIRQPVIDENGRVSEKPKGFFDEYTNQLDELIH